MSCAACAQTADSRRVWRGPSYRHLPYRNARAAKNGSFSGTLRTIRRRGGRLKPCACGHKMSLKRSILRHLRVTRMRWPLRYQILVPFAGVMLVVLLGVSLLNAYLAARRSSQQTAAKLREVARTLAEARFPLTDAVLLQTHGLSGAHFVLTEPDGEIAAASLAIDRSSIAGGRGAASWEQLDLGRPIAGRRRALLSCGAAAAAAPHRGRTAAAPYSLSRADICATPAGRPPIRRWPSAAARWGWWRCWPWRSPAG